MIKRLSILNCVAFLLMLVCNYLSMTGFFNGETNKTVSDRYPTLFTPAEYAFSIWGIIFLALLGFVIYGLAVHRRAPENRFIKQIGWWFIISCLANCFWLICFSFEWIGLSVLVMIILLISLIMIILATNMERSDPPLRKVALLWWPFALYAGWVSVALIANVAVWLTKTGWSGGGISPVNWTVIMLSIAGLLGILITWRRNMREFTAPLIWGFIAIAVANHGHHATIISAVWVVSAVVALSTIVHGAMHFRGFGKEL